MNLGELTEILGFVLTLVTSMVAMANWLLSRWENAKKRVELHKSTLFQMRIEQLEGVLKEHKDALREHGQKITELDKAITVTGNHQQELNRRFDEFREELQSVRTLVSGFLKTLSARPDLLDLEPMGGGNYKLKKKNE